MKGGGFKGMFLESDSIFEKGRSSESGRGLESTACNLRLAVSVLGEHVLAGAVAAIPLGRSEGLRVGVL